MRRRRCSSISSFSSEEDSEGEQGVDVDGRECNVEGRGFLELRRDCNSCVDYSVR